MYRRLIPEAITQTVRTLHLRIDERFPDSSLRQVCAELLEVAQEAEERSAQMRRPLLWLRLVQVLLIALIVAGLAVIPLAVEMHEGLGTLASLVQVVESGINDVIFVGLALFFVATLETRLKRRSALRAVHELRVLAHVIDMHQLTKDPVAVSGGGPNTPSSPRRAMSLYELERYLDYCSELLSLVGKVGALYAQDLDDTVVLEAVNDIESLTNGLARKVWQKIIISRGLAAEQPLRAQA